MKRLLYIPLLCLLSACASTQPIAEAQVREHFRFIAAHTDLEFDPETLPAPPIQFSSQRELLRIYLGAERFSQLRTEYARVSMETHIEGAFNPDTGIVYLSERVNPDTVWGRSVLAHELTHYVQVASGQEYVCLSEAEPQAYDIQIRYLEQAGKPSPFDPFTIKVRSICEDY